MHERSYMMLFCMVMQLMTSRYRSPHRAGYEYCMICSVDTMFGLLQELALCLNERRVTVEFSWTYPCYMQWNLETTTERDIKKTYEPTHNSMKWKKPRQLFCRII